MESTKVGGSSHFLDYHSGGNLRSSQIYKDLELVDRVGGGDSFSSGLIYSLLQEKSAQEAVDFAGAYSALAHTFPGDFNWATVEEAEKAMQSGSVRINR